MRGQSVGKLTAFNLNDLKLGYSMTAKLPLLDIFDAILNQPTAPFNEYYVKGAVKNLCVKYSIPYVEDVLGDLWLNTNDLSLINKAPLLLTSYIDHSGIVIESSYENRAKGKWFGECPNNLIGMPLKVFNKENVTTGSVMAIQGDNIFLKTERAIYKPSAACYFKENYSIENETLKTHASENLISACCIIDAIRHANTQAIALFTKSEQYHSSGVQKMIKLHKINSEMPTLVIGKAKAFVQNGFKNVDSLTAPVFVNEVVSMQDVKEFSKFLTKMLPRCS